MERTPTFSEVTGFISSLLPPRSNDVPLLYHTPRTHYDFETALVEQVVLSVTPTPQVYDAIGHSTHGATATSPQNRQASQNEEAQLPYTICFLHRPFTLDSHRIRKDLLVLASHTSFDENLTVGFNPALAERLGVRGSETVCVQGYNGDESRKIGLIGRVSMILGTLLHSIEEEFGAFEHAQEGLSEEIHVVAIMNAFHTDQVLRVLDMAQEQDWVPSVENLGRHILYLTGQPRESGLAAAKERGMTVVCVGHRVGEQWGITYMAERLRATFPSLRVKEIYEDEARNEQHDEQNPAQAMPLPVLHAAYYDRLPYAIERWSASADFTYPSVLIPHNGVYSP